MAYQTGVASNRVDLITSLLTFCAANGFELGPQWVVGTGSIYSLKKGLIYFNIQVTSASNGYIYLNTGLSAGSGELAGQVQAAPYNFRVDNLHGPYVGYHFFSDDNGVNVVVEIVTNVFTHFNFGVLQKNGDFVGGEYVTGLHTPSTDYINLFRTYNHGPFGHASVGAAGQLNANGHSGHIRTPVAGPVACLGVGLTPPYAIATGMADNAGRPLIDVSPNTFNGRSVLVPINIVQGSSGTTGPYYQLGTVGNARFLSIANLNPKEMVNTDWMVFPISQKNGPGTTYINSGNYGIAYRV